MFEVRVTADFAAAHFLQDYNGKCENLHGHNYKVYAHVKGNQLNEGGMLLDFTFLKKSLRKVCASMDHTNLNENPFFKQNPSAERIALYIYQLIILDLESQGIDLKKTAPTADGQQKAFLYAIDVFETDTSRARYIPD
ncbi:MAG: 6-carboxytetrahydropterin synthase QueD [Treponema sp.]|nr:6-carboxytetrahydropterin synthase QueD [Treponema sp.]